VFERDTELADLAAEVPEREIEDRGLNWMAEGAGYLTYTVCGRRGGPGVATSYSARVTHCKAEVLQFPVETLGGFLFAVDAYV